MIFYCNFLFLRDLKVFFCVFCSMCCPNWTQACSHIIGYIPGPIGSLLAIAPTHFLVFNTKRGTDLGTQVVSFDSNIPTSYYWYWKCSLCFSGYYGLGWLVGEGWHVGGCKSHFRKPTLIKKKKIETNKTTHTKRKYIFK